MGLIQAQKVVTFLSFPLELGTDGAHSILEISDQREENIKINSGANIPIHL